MSCDNPVMDTDALMPKKKRYDKTQYCVRCKVARGNIVIRYAVYCKTCFFPLIGHKFRRALEPNVNPKPDGRRRTALKPAGNLLIGFSGGLGSTVLLDSIHEIYVSMANIPAQGGTEHPRHERVWPKVSVCYVEVCDAYPGMKEKTNEIAEHVARHHDVDFIPLRLQDAFDHKWWKRTHGMLPSLVVGADLSNEDLLIKDIAHSSSEAAPLDLLRTHLSSLPTSTAVISTVQTLVRLLLLYTAVETGSSHLVLGTSLTSLAVSLISGISQGRGFNVREETQEEWYPEDAEHPPRDSGKQKTARQFRRSVRVVRPLRDVGMKECALWVWWKKLHVVGKAKRDWGGARQEIGTLTRDFIVGLERDYPSTVSTIVKTCEKLAPRGDVAGKCLICERPIQGGVQEWKSRISIRTLQDDESDPPSAESFQEHPQSASGKRGLTPYLCYACHTAFTSRSSRSAAALYPASVPQEGTPMPAWVNHTLGQHERYSTQQMSLDEMKSVVGEFLLD